MSYTGFEIAVVGLAGKFPKADNIQQFWNNLKTGRDCISELSVDDIQQEGEADELLRDPSYVKSNAFLENKEHFDADFFGYLPDEAELMDPQIRLFHECCWEALEDSGYSKSSYPEKVGLFAAGSPNVNWELYAVMKNQEGLVDDFSASHLRGVSFLSTKISYKFNLKGPAVFLQTACSSSLGAIHQACSSLLWGECSIALAGGVTVTNRSHRGYLYKEGMINSRDGKCRPFDAQSSGTVAGEGLGVVVLKKLKDAIRDRDNIYAVIKGTAMNNDGSDKVGYTAPSVDGQAEAIRKAQKMAKVRPESISYIEAHGTATELGDPIEIEALNQAFGNPTEKYCAIGSVKSNIGHLDTAAGVAGFIKAVLSLKHREIPASLHYTEANPQIKFDEGPFYVNNRHMKWEAPEGPLRAGVSSFGIGGTNVHVVLEEAPKLEEPSEPKTTPLMVFSAKSQESLDRYSADMKRFLEGHRETPLIDIAYTLQKGRVRFPFRKTIACSTHEEAIEALSSGNITSKEGKIHEALQAIIFMFSGQGSQYLNMCKDLYEGNADFRINLDTCIQLAAKYSTENFYKILFPGNEESPERNINDTQYTQPLLFMIEYSLAKVLMDWGVQPDYMIGHSLGEYVAACLSGVFTLEDALKLVIRRGELMGEVAAGSMLSVEMSKEELQPFLQNHKQVNLSVINSHSSRVVSGKDEDIASIEKELASAGFTSKKLHTSHAFHSYMMEEIQEKFEQAFAGVEISSPQIPYISNVHGKMVSYEEIKSPSYWSQHLTHAVRFQEGIDTLLDLGNSVLIEIGPGRTLCNYVQKSSCFTEKHETINLVRQAKQAYNDEVYFIEKIGQLWENGVELDWEAFYQGEKRNRVSLPTYSFEKDTFTSIIDSRKFLQTIDGNQLVSGPMFRGNPIHELNWRSSLLPNVTTEVEKMTHPCLIFVDEDGFIDELGTLLSSKGLEVIQVKSGKQFAKEAHDVFVLNPASTHDLEELWDHLEGQNRMPQHIVYALPLTENLKTVNHQEIEQGLVNNYLGLSYLGKSLAKREHEQQIRISVIGNHIVKVMNGDEVNPLKSTILGPVKIIPVEILNLTCKLVDIPFIKNQGKEKEVLLGQLINEIFFDNDEPVVAYRYGERWLPAYNQVQLHERTDSQVKIVSKGVYVIVGGFGGMGFSVAQDLVLKQGAKVILIHRSEFPLRKNWSNYLSTQDSEDRTSQKIRILQKMEEVNGQVDLYQVDVSEEKQVKHALEDILHTYPQINGLIWAAGEVDHGGIIQHRDAGSFTSFLTSKVHGLLNVEQYLNFNSLDFVALFSSMGNVFYHTKYGQVAYNAANEFLDGYALYGQKRWNTHVFSINWSDWLDVGMTFKTLESKLKDKTPDLSTVNSHIEKGIAPEEGVQIFYDCLQNKAPVSAIYSGDMLTGIATFKAKYEKLREGLEISSERAGSKVQGESELLAIITRVFQRFFGRKKIRIDEDFFELGGDSLKAVTLVSRLNQETGTKISITDLYKFPSIRLLTDKLVNAAKSSESILIPPAVQKDKYELSSAQKRMYFLQMLDKESTVYNEVIPFWIKGALDKARLQVAFTQLIERHESLHTAFVMELDSPKQVLSENLQIEIEEIEYKGEELAEIMTSFIRPFDLEKAPLVRIGLVEKAVGEYLIITDSHHIIADGLSKGILIKDLMTLYNQEILPPLSLQYKDFSEWEQSEAQQASMVSQQKFWMDEFKGDVPVLNLPIDYPRPLIKSYEGDFVSLNIGPNETRELRKISEAEGTGLFTIFLAVFHILLKKLSGQNDIVIGTPIGGRHHSDLEKMIGVFVNVLPIRNVSDNSQSFRKFLQIVKNKSLACLDNQAYPYEQLIENLALTRDTSRNALFDVMINFVNFEEAFPKVPGMELEPCNWRQKTSKFDLTMWAYESKDDIRCMFEYPTELFKEETIHTLSEYLQRIIRAITQNQEVLVGDIEILSEKERNHLLYDFNQTKVSFPREATIVSLFEQQVALTPHKKALIYQNDSLTYAELDRRANQLALYLRQRFTVKPNKLIGVMMPRTIEMFVSLLAILKSGAAYLPIDPTYPDKRISHILKDSDASILLVDKPWESAFEYKGTVLNVQEIYLEKVTENTPHLQAAAQDLAYVIYTSGSTGNPKGVKISHSNVVNFFTGMNEQLKPGTNESMLAVTSTSFDISVLELFWTLCQGIEVVMHASDISMSGLDRYLPGEEQVMDFSIFFFSSYNNQDDDKYSLMLESVKYADQAGFKAVWTPERHFHEFGGLYPNPSVMSSALAMVTNQIQLRSGSVVAPLHDTVRIAEEWSVVDNLSGGRVGLSIASGWNPNDFVLSSTEYTDRHRAMYAQIEEVKKLWRGGSITRENGFGQEVDLKVFPKPLQGDLPIWITSGGNEETFKSAGAAGLNLLTHLLGQDVDDLGRKIRLYKEARKDHGFDPEAGEIAIMLHTYVGDDLAEVEQVVEQPFIEYLKSSVGLSKVLLKEANLNEQDLTEEDREKFYKNTFQRYYKTSALIGTKETCSKLIEKLKEIGITEVACLVDFGIEKEQVIQGLSNLNALRENFTGYGGNKHRPITMLQSTPSYMKLLEEDTGSQKFLQSLTKILVGGEAFPQSLLHKLQQRSKAKIFNMYGPTETTIWSSVHAFTENEEQVSIGKPIANTHMYILGDSLNLLPAGIAGDLYIGGAGVSSGYWNKPGLTSERFVDNPFKSGEKIYKTGDIARWLPNGNLEYMGRKDTQVKIKGHRIELGEIERCIASYENLEEVVVEVIEEHGNKLLVAYVIAEDTFDMEGLKSYLTSTLPYYMIPAYCMTLPEFPLTPNGKVDRKALPIPTSAGEAEYIAPTTETEKKLVEIWAQILSVETDKISITRSFFELGGHSLNATVLVNVIFKEFGVEYSLQKIFVTNTIEQIAEHIDNELWIKGGSKTDILEGDEIVLS